MLLAYSFSFRELLAVLLAVILVQVLTLFHLSGPSKEKLLVFHRAKETIIAREQQEQLIIIYNNPEEIDKLPGIKNYHIGAEMAVFLSDLCATFTAS